MRNHFASTSLALALSLLATWPTAHAAEQAAPALQLGERLAKPSPPAKGKADNSASSSYRQTEWDALVPKGWDPQAAFKGLDFAKLSDSDPRAAAAMKQMQEAWSLAPAEPAMNDQRIRIAGFVVPLDGGQSAGVQEFLLVPYFGACVHSPPPPANQIIHVRAGKPLKGMKMMDAVWISGTLKAEKSDTAEGVSGYTMSSELVTPYQWPK